jgi:hypothetical protein
MHRGTVATGITDAAPLYKAVAMVDVALSTSMMTTMLSVTSYKCKRAGEKHVNKEGLG